MEALLVSENATLIWGLPYLLSRAGFAVDAITATRLMGASQFTRSVVTARSGRAAVEMAHHAICSRKIAYELVVPGNDKTLKAMSLLEWPAAARPKFLPAPEEQGESHLFSKIGLSRLLRAKGILTPPFEVAKSCAEGVDAANQLGYPVFLKEDASGGGSGVHACRCEADVRSCGWLFGDTPVLVQKGIGGRELDLSAIYLEGELVHFAYSTIERAMPHFGPSIVRRYYPLPLVDGAVFEELAALGPILGAHGFVTISAIEAADGSGRHYIEADMRPNVWMDMSTFYGEDPSERMRRWYSARARLTKANATGGAGEQAEHSPVTIPYFLRLAPWELAVNRYDAWRFIPTADRSVVLRLLLRRCAASFARPFLPAKMRRAILRRLGTAGLRWV